MKRWPTKLLGDFVVRKSGSVDPSKFPDEIFDLYSIPAFDSREPDVRVGREIGSAKQIVESGDVLLSRIVPHIRRAWVVGADRGRRLIASGEWIVFRSQQLHPRYLRYFLVGNPFHSRFMQTVSGVGGSLLRAKATEVAKIEIPVPPLAEQDRIVKLLDEADELRKLRAQADRRTAALIPALFHEMFGDPVANPKKLPIVSLDNLLSFRTGKLDSNAAVEDGEYPFFTCSREDSRIDSYAFDCEALLLAGNNAVGDYSVKYYKGKFNAYQRTYVLNLLDEGYSYSFMQYALQLRLQELKRLSLGTNTKYLTLGILKNINIPLPDYALQQEFAQRVSEIRALEAAQAASRKRVEHLFQSMLHRAFNQEL